MKERIKSFVLVLLILSSIGLTSITWIDERLWPDGYSLFVNVKEWPVIREFFEKSYSQPMENLSKARKIVIADGSGSSAVFYNGDSTFNDVYSDINDFMTSFLSGEVAIKETTLLTKENVRELLNEQVMYTYVNYSVSMPGEFFGQLMGVADTEVFSDTGHVRDFFILPTGEDSLELLAIDNKTESVMRYELQYEKTTDLIEKFIGYAEDVPPENYCVMALQMNMDKTSPDDVVQMKTLLDSFLILDSASTADGKKMEIESRNLIASGVPAEVIRCFAYSPDSLYRYVDGEGTIIYLENDSSLKIHKNGLIEYEATSREYGIPLSGGYSVYETLNSAIRFAGDVYLAASSGGEFAVNVSSDTAFTSGDERVFFFDYYYEGTPVATVINESGKQLKHAIEMTVSGGRVTGFRMLLRSYAKTERKRDFINIYGAIDKIAAKYEDAEEPVKIEDMFPAYMEDGASERILPCWVGYVEGKQIIISQ
ncbi:MAG: hypothetical protein Q4G23_09420 [Clostridia bacterium]|nr:hypothetical protein [Clostridia bacterium]